MQKVSEIAPKAQTDLLKESPIFGVILWPKKWRHRLKLKLRTIIYNKNRPDSTSGKTFASGGSLYGLRTNKNLRYSAHFRILIFHASFVRIPNKKTIREKCQTKY